VVLTSQVAARAETQYGDFVGVPEPVNWSDVDRDCRRLMMRTKDMRLAVLFTRCRTRLAGAAGLAEGLGLLDAWLNAFADTVHPRLDVDEDRDAALEIRMNALQALTDADGLFGDIREITLNRSSATRLQVRDIERAFASPRPNDALAPESVTRQLEDLRTQRPDALADFDSATASLDEIESWSREHLGAYMPDYSSLKRVLARVVGSGPICTSALEIQDAPIGEVVDIATPDAVPIADANQTIRPALLPNEVVTQPNSAVLDRLGALARIKEARQWFEQHEPSSPIPLLLKRAEHFVGKRYAEVVKAIPPELLEQWDTESTIR
jgi:type VI secretion system protein ImpA